MNELPKVHEWEVNQIIDLQKELGFHEERSLATSDLLTLVLTSTYFFGEMEDLLLSINSQVRFLPKDVSHVNLIGTD
jgi:hypothetical protein